MVIAMDLIPIFPIVRPLSSISCPVGNKLHTRDVDRRLKGGASIPFL